LVLKNYFCLGWLWTLILQISVSQVARITGLSHWDWQPCLRVGFESPNNGIPKYVKQKQIGKTEKSTIII
jgi:hypothetical protein